MTTLNRLWHEVVLRHGLSWVEIGKPNGGRKVRRRYGVLVECPCGKRWIARAPWDLT